MRKSIIASIIVLSAMGGVAHAADAGVVTFAGTVTPTTCDLVPTVGGLADNAIRLPAAAPNTEGAAVDFALKPVDPAAPGCTGLAGKTVSVDWFGNITDQGLSTTGEAAGTFVQLASKNAKAPAVITASSSVSEFDAGKLTSEGLEYSAKTKAGPTAGTFQSVGRFNVSYK